MPEARTYAVTLLTGERLVVEVDGRLEDKDWGPAARPVRGVRPRCRTALGLRPQAVVTFQAIPNETPH